MKYRYAEDFGVLFWLSDMRTTMFNAYWQLEVVCSYLCASLPVLCCNCIIDMHTAIGHSVLFRFHQSTTEK